MCGITGFLGDKHKVEVMLEAQKARGKDAQKISENSGFFLGHNLHSIIDFVKQPLENKFVFNGEIYNWKELGKGKNDAEVVLKLLEKEGLEALDKLDGVYAFAWIKNKKLYLVRDLIGVKPIWYSERAFASEKKALLAVNEHAIELNPRKILEWDLETGNKVFLDRKFFSVEPTLKVSEEEAKEKVKKLLKKAILKRVPEQKVALLFSGGVDSSVIAAELKELNVPFKCFVAGLKEAGLKDSEDVIEAKKVAEEMGLDLEVINVGLQEVEEYLKKVVPLIEDNNVVKIGVALTFFLCAEKASEQGYKIIFSGLGSEEIFAGYNRHLKTKELNKECLSGLRKLYERDLYRDDVVTMANTIELRLPFLDKELVAYSLRLPFELKLHEKGNKYLLRSIAEEMNVPSAWRKKLAAQYGSRFDNAIHRLAKHQRFKSKSDYVKQFYDKGNVPLAVLWSGGKDCALAAWVMKKQGYELKCFVTLESENPDSYMFHTPNVHLASLQAEAAGLPIIVQKTNGEKEKELGDLYEALKRAQESGAEGVVTGALFSEYQRTRVEEIADSLGLKVFSPLWHMDQELELRFLLKEKFDIVFSSVAAEGLDESFLGKKLNETMIDKLVKTQYLNPAGEGGEFESLVLWAPFFKKRLSIESFSVMKKGLAARMIVKQASLS